MTQVKFIGKRPVSVCLPGGQREIRVTPGDVLDVPDHVAESLLRQRRKYERVEWPSEEPEDDEVYPDDGEPYLTGDDTTESEDEEE